jgi:hypothetical protein
MIGSMRGVILGAALASSVGFGTGWLVNGWRLGEQISQREAEDAKQEQQELLDALAERDANAARNEELSVQLAQAREDIRTEIRLIEREVPNVVEDDRVCDLSPAAVQLWNIAATGDRSPRPRSPRRRPAAEVPGGAGDSEPE